GETWDVSRIVLSWEDVESRGAAGEPFNVVIHEFAHYLDHESAGAPWAKGEAARQRWKGLLEEELRSLRAQVDAGEQTLLDPYAAEDRDEFFAVASEAFFEEPAALARRMPALYRALADLYRLDPAAW
ncbi:MAG: zinc-dependent peptidase, partial [Steroidobacteraceae bacterium]